MKLKNLISLCLLTILFGLLIGNALAKPLKPEEVPAPLKPWVDWVSQGKEDKRCPFLFADFNQHFCAWPDELKLILKSSGAEFSQHWQVYQDSWLTLPGEERYWPLEVTLNDKPAVVVSHDGVPAVQVGSGSYLLKGRFKWSALPKSLAIPANTALLAVTLNDTVVNFPRIENNRLWLQVTQQQKVEDRFDFQVFRHIDDTIPAQITFYLDMQVAGSAREMALDLPLTDKFVPLRLQSPLPARLDSDNKLRLQVRPGRWAVQLTVRHIGPLSALTMQKSAGLWTSQEVWVFNAQPLYRIVNISGVSAIDPQQTLLPDQWKQLPAYRVTPGETMTFTEERRGDPDPGADNLTLNRTLWLGFNGDQYTIQDQISGIKKTDWRMELNAPVELGQVTIDNLPQFITRLEGSPRSGVEVRQGNINMTADSVLRGDIHTLPATGWNENFNGVRTSLNIPPGYKVFSISGADNVSATWLNRWTLLDIFLVLLITAAVGKLWGKPLGAITLITLTLIYHEANAPVWIWLFVILGFALLRVLPSGRLRRWVMAYRNITLIALILITVPFFIQQIRTSLYPQLERFYQTAVPMGVSITSKAYEQYAEPAPAPQEIPEADMLEEEPLESLRSGAGLFRSAPSKKMEKKKSRLEFYDPNAILQTGPGLPQWQWNTVNFSWSGPVDTGQTVHITYIGPVANFLLGWLRVILVSALILGLLGARLNRQQGIRFPSIKSLSSIVLLGLCGVILFVGPDTAKAEFPNKSLLQELETRLFSPPDCLPDCAAAQSMTVTLKPDMLTLELTINAIETVAIPLPGQAEHWTPQKILLDGQRALGVIKDQSGTFWLPVGKGRHNIKLQGMLPGVDSVQLPLPLKPHFVSITSDGWSVVGVHDDGSIDTQLQFDRTSQQGLDKTAEFNTVNLPPFVQVQRNLLLGLDWRVHTTITRVSPTGTAVVLQIPLLPGESVTTEGVRVENSNVLINMSAGQTSADWQSLLSMKDKDNNIVNEIKLVAPENNSWTEIWNLDVSPIWHVQYQGIPVIRHQQANRWLPQWRPWPGEQVVLSLSRPQGVEGQTTTIDYSRLEITPGIRITNASLTFNLRSSQGGQHPVVLPENSSLQEVKIDNAPLPLRLKDNTLMLPVKPGAQQYTITWQEPRGISSRYTTSRVDIGSSNVNNDIALNVPGNRVVLFVGGPAMGPAVLFWGVIIVFLLASIALSQFKSVAPLRYWQWALLSVGLVPISVASAMVVIAWFFVSGFRCRLAHDADKWKFNLYQLSLVGFTLITAGTLVYAVSQGLLGIPDMQIYGNGSNQYVLNWYQDMNPQSLPQSWMLTIPMLAYRILMLLWALWLAFSVISWSRWFWNCFTTHGYWRSVDWKKKAKKPVADKAALTAGPVTGKQPIEGSALEKKSPDDTSH